MRLAFTITILFLSFSVFAQEFVDKTPDWYNNPPKSRRKIYGVGMGQERELTMAEKEAKLIANVNIAEQVDSIKIHQTKRVKRSKHGETIIETRQKEVIEASLSGVNVVKKVVMVKNHEYVVFVLLEMDKKRR